MKHVRDIMTMDPIQCTPQTTLAQVSKLMLHYDYGEIPVVDSFGSKKPVGVITDRDIVCRGLAHDKNAEETPVEGCMSRPAITVTPDTRTDECCNLMTKHGIRRILVIDKTGQLCGIVAQADIARFLTVQQKADFFERISSPSSQIQKKSA